jgi:hypothetical protein
MPHEDRHPHTREFKRAANLSSPHPPTPDQALACMVLNVRENSIPVSMMEGIFRSWSICEPPVVSCRPNTSITTSRSVVLAWRCPPWPTIITSTICCAPGWCPRHCIHNRSRLLSIVETSAGTSGSVAMRGTWVGGTCSWVRRSRRRGGRTLVIPHFRLPGRRWWAGIVVRVFRRPFRNAEVI